MNSSKTVLVVDDEKPIRKIYVRILQAMGPRVMEILEAEDAEEVKRFLESKKIDLVLLDIKLPGINGQELAKIIEQRNPEAKIVVASVYPIDRQKEMIPFAVDYYDKSKGPLKLLEKVSQLLLTSD